MSFNNRNILKKINQISAEKQNHKNYQHVAMGVLQRINIHPEAKDLSTILGSCTPRKNLTAVTEWIIEDNPNLESFGREAIEEYTARLKSELECFYEC